MRELLDLVQLPAAYMNRFPHAFSRRPAPADRHRPRAGAQPGADRRRRAGLGARRLGPGADRQSVARPPGPARPLLSVRRPRPLGREARQRPGRGHVCRQDRRAGADRGAVRQPAPPLYRGAAVGGAGARPAPARAADRASRARSPTPPTRRRAAISIPAALCDRALPDGRRRRCASWPTAISPAATAPRS